MIPTPTQNTAPAGNTDPDLGALLASALEQEGSMLDTLRDIFAAQRKALVIGDPVALEDGVFAATRVMRTLDEARHRRRAITTALWGGESDGEELDRLLAGSAARPIRRARERLRSSAERLRREVALLRAILYRALEENRSHLDVLLGTERPNRSVPASYDQGGMATGEAGTGVVVDRTA
jgi:hypothetical protein